MKHLIKKTFTIALITNLLLFGSVFYMLPFSFAESSIPAGWTQATSNEELADAFRYYCKSRNLVIDGSLADAITSFTTNTFNSICSELGINSTLLQAEIASRTNGNTGLEWFFTSNGISFYNRIFAEFLQNNDLTVGDSVLDKRLYNGYYFDHCLLFITDTYIARSITGAVITFTTIGSPYISANGLVSIYNANNKTTPISFTIQDVSNLTLPMYEVDGYINNNQDVNGYYAKSSPSYASAILPVPITGYTHRFIDYFGYAALVYSTSDQKIYLCEVVQKNDGSVYYLHKPSGNSLGSHQPDNVFINITTNNNVINNNTYEGDTIINQDGNTSDGSGGGSGGGSSGGGDTNINVDFPHITLPDLSGIDWSLDGLASKFPFCIPFDLYHFVDVLDAEPETPAFTGSINLIVTTWDLDYDLSAFDDLAAIVRNVEFIGFCLGLIFITRKIIKG